MLHDVWQAETKAAAEKAYDLFVATYQAKYAKATDCLYKDREELQVFYDFPALHWIHLRTTHPIESAFATVRHRTSKTSGSGCRSACLTMVASRIGSVFATVVLRTSKTKGSGCRSTCLTMVFKLMGSASKRRRLLT